MHRSALFLGGALVLVSAFPAQAQYGPTGNSIKFRIGAFLPSGSSEFWDANEAAFTLDHNDFDDGMIGASYVAAINNHFEMGFNIDFYESTVRSADREFVDQAGFPILHDTRLRLAPLTVDVRFLPGGRYRVRGARGDRLVRKPVPVLGAGAGANFWRYEEFGDFVASDQSIVFDRLDDDGVEFERHVLAGVELPVGAGWAFTFEGRYSWSEATPSGPFTPLELGKLDLSGASVLFGGSVQF
jgi:hypothetical protein